MSPHDEYLFHQVAAPVSQVGTSDPRFYDRHWLAVYDQSGEFALQATLAIYPNMNVADAALVIVHRGRQFNVRGSRSLRPDYAMTVGPFAFEVLEPYRHLRFTLSAGDHPLATELNWTSDSRVEEEPQHLERRRDRIIQDWHRYDQVGTCAGWVQLPGERLSFDDVWAARDHSWGVRPGMGIPEPVTGPEEYAYATSSYAAADPTKTMNILPTERFVFMHFFLTTTKLSGHMVAFYEDDHVVRFKGKLQDPTQPDGAQVEVVDAAVAVELVPDTRRFQRVVVDLDLSDGRHVLLEETSVGSSIAMTGLGYSGGYSDQRGLGVWRGERHIESDIWDVTHAEDVIFEDGSVGRPLHRLQPVNITVSGGGADGNGFGSTTLVYGGELPSVISVL